MTVGFNFAPRGWALCDGQLLPISQNSALFSLLGTTYGGDGRTNFGLPDLRGRTAVHVGNGPGLSPYRWGEKGGAERVTLNLNQIPSHAHTLRCKDTNGTTSNPSGKFLAKAPDSTALPPTSTDLYADDSNGLMAPTSVTPNGGGQAHENRVPYLAVYHCIALTGIFPSRS